MRQVECIIPVLQVQSLARSIEFYRDILGFRLDWGGQEGSRICSIARDGQSTMLSLSEKVSSGAWVWIGLEDDSLFQACIAKGVKIVQEPTNRPHAYEMRIEDPDGNVLWLGTEPRKE